MSFWKRKSPDEENAPPDSGRPQDEEASDPMPLFGSGSRSAGDFQTAASYPYEPAPRDPLRDSLEEDGPAEDSTSAANAGAELPGARESAPSAEASPEPVRQSYFDAVAARLARSREALSARDAKAQNSMPLAPAPELPSDDAPRATSLEAAESAAARWPNTEEWLRDAESEAEDTNGGAVADELPEAGDWTSEDEEAPESIEGTETEGTETPDTPEEEKEKRRRRGGRRRSRGKGTANAGSPAPDTESEPGAALPLTHGPVEIFPLQMTPIAAPSSPMYISAPAAAEDQRLALFCDFENISIGLQEARQKKFSIELVLERLLEKGKIVVKKAYADWERYSEYKRAFHEAGVELIEIPKKSYSGKNSADIRMVVDAMDLSASKDHINCFVIISGDSDFSPLVSKLKENNKFVIGMGVKNSSSEMLINNCDEFIYYEDVVRGLSRMPTFTDLPKKKMECFTLLLESIKALKRENKDILWGSMVKQTMQRKKPSFNEEYYGYDSFSNLLEDAQAHNILKLKRDARSGTYVIIGFAQTQV